MICTPGKIGSSVLSSLLSEYSDKFHTPISHTSRENREGETEGLDYYFVEPAEFARMEKAGEFIESTKVGDSGYGTAKSTVIMLAQQGLVPLLDVDADGAKMIHVKSPAFTPPSYPPSHPSSNLHPPASLSHVLALRSPKSLVEYRAIASAFFLTWPFHNSRTLRASPLRGPSQTRPARPRA